MMKLHANKRTCADEQGSSLILVMVFLSAIGVLSAALVSYELTINKQSFSTRRMQAREAGVNTGVEWIVNSLREGRDGFCQGGYDNDVINVSGREVAVSCRTAGTDTAANNVALYLNATDPPELNVIGTAGSIGSDGRPTIVDPIYNGNMADGKSGWELRSPLNIATATDSRFTRFWKFRKFVSSACRFSKPVAASVSATCSRRALIASRRS